MFNFIPRQKHRLTFRFAISLLVTVFISNLIFPPVMFGQNVTSTLAGNTINLPPVGSMVLTSEAQVPPIMTGLSVYPDNPLMFDFFIDTGDVPLSAEALADETTKLIKYFMAALTVPEEDIWVNLSPYESGRIIPEKLGFTEMGRDMLSQDYLLKQFASSMTFPENQLGQKFWEDVYAKVRSQPGNENFSLNTFNKVWIVPDKAVVYEREGVAFVGERHLKIMLEEDYMAMKQHTVSEKSSLAREEKMNPEMKSVFTEIIIPRIEEEVNKGKNFAMLRQIYNSLILAMWYKKTLRESLLGQVYVDQNKVDGIDIQDKEIKEKIYRQYLESFKAGVFDYMKEDYDPISQEIIPRKYFSGGVVPPTQITTRPLTTEGADSAQESEGPVLKVTAVLVDQAQTGEDSNQVTRRSFLKTTSFSLLALLLLAKAPSVAFSAGNKNVTELSLMEQIRRMMEESDGYYGPVEAQIQRTLEVTNRINEITDMSKALTELKKPQTLEEALSIFWQGPKSFDNEQNILDFIFRQIQGGAGLPKTFYIPQGLENSIPYDGPIQRMLLERGSWTYDTSLAIMNLIEAEDLQSAGELLDIYASGHNGNMELRAKPTAANGGAYHRFTDEAYFIFNTTDVSGQYSPEWVSWETNTGPNAWLILAINTFIEKMEAAGNSVNPSIKELAKAIGNGLLLMQQHDEGIDTQGGILFGPGGQFVPPGSINPHDVINLENTVSAYAALLSLYKSTKDSRYLDGAKKIERFLKSAEVYTAEGQKRTGLLDRETMTFPIGVYYNKTQKRWILQDGLAADSAGTWAISSLGPAFIDELAGQKGAAFSMWLETRRRTGKTWWYANSTPDKPIIGLDFTDAYFDTEDANLISPEWSAGGIHALEELIAYYGNNLDESGMTQVDIDDMKRDIESMELFLKLRRAFRLSPDQEDFIKLLETYMSNSYAHGLGLEGLRRGKTGFGLTAPLRSIVQAMAAIFQGLTENPLAKAREGISTLQSEPKVENETEKAVKRLNMIKQLVTDGSSADPEQIKNPTVLVVLDAMERQVKQILSDLQRQEPEILIGQASFEDLQYAQEVLTLIANIRTKFNIAPSDPNREMTEDNFYYLLDFWQNLSADDEARQTVDEFFPLTALDIFMPGGSSNAGEALLELIKASSAWRLKNDPNLMADDPKNDARRLFDLLLNDQGGGEMATYKNGKLVKLSLTSNSVLPPKAMVYQNQQRTHGKRKKPSSSTQPSLIPAVDSAILATEKETRTKDNLGGIDFTFSDIGLEIKRDSKGIPLPLPQQPAEFRQINGLTPVILKVIPINIPFIISEFNLDDSPQKKSRRNNRTADPFKELDQVSFDPINNSVFSDSI